MASARARERERVCEGQRKRESERLCVCIVLLANEILVSVAHNDQVPRCHPTQDTLPCAKERERERQRERREKLCVCMGERWTGN